VKKIILIFLVLFGYGYDIVLNNAKIDSLDVKKIPEIYIKTFKVYEPYEKKEYQFSGITLKKLVELYGKSSNKMEFKAVDNYEITFNEDEINDENIMFMFKQNGKFIGFDAKGPARIIYINQNPSHIQKNNIKWIWMIVEATFK
jgi:hypothetical protein